MAHMLCMLLALTSSCFGYVSDECIGVDDVAECTQASFLQVELARQPPGLPQPKFPTENVTAPADVAACIDEMFPLLVDKRFEDCIKQDRNECGDISRDPPQMSSYIAVAIDPSVKTICETGFFSGRSSALWLCSNPEVKVYSFDIIYPEENLKVIQDKFGDRFTHHEGDSTITLTNFASDPDSPFCDVMIADGGHFDEIPWIDMQNFAKIAAKEPDRKHTFIVDEIYTYRDFNKCCQDVTDTYEKAVQLNMLNTSAGYCQEFECYNLFDTTCHGRTVPRFPPTPADPENSMNSTYPNGGFCVMAFEKDYLNSLDAA